MRRFFERFRWRQCCLDIEEAADDVPTQGNGEVVREQHGPEGQLPVFLALHLARFAGSPGGVVTPGFGRRQADGVKGTVPPVGFAGLGEFVEAVVHEVAQVFPDFGDVLNVGFGGFVAIDPEAVFLMEGAVCARWGEGKGVNGRK